MGRRSLVLVLVVVVYFQLCNITSSVQEYISVNEPWTRHGNVSQKDKNKNKNKNFIDPIRNTFKYWFEVWCFHFR